MPKNSAKAIEIFKTLDESGWPFGASLIAQTYEEAVGVPDSLKQAEHWKRIQFKRTKEFAEQGHVHSQVYVGEYYLIGYGVLEDDLEGVRWLRLAAKRGQPQAHFLLGECYENGKGVVQDFIEAYKFYNLASSPPDPEMAIFALDKAESSSAKKRSSKTNDFRTDRRSAAIVSRV